MFQTCLFFFACSKIWLGHARRVESGSPLVMPVVVTCIGFAGAVFDEVSWMRVEQPLVSFCGQLRRVQRQLGGWALCMEAQWLAVGSWFVATNPAPNDGDDAWLLCVGAIHPDLRLTFRRASSLSLSTGALSHTMWSGSSRLYRLALGLRTAVPGAKNTVLTACFRLASWTGQFQVVPRALSPFCDMIVHCVHVMSGH